MVTARDGILYFPVIKSATLWKMAALKNKKRMMPLRQTAHVQWNGLNLKDLTGVQEVYVPNPFLQPWHCQWPPLSLPTTIHINNKSFNYDVSRLQRFIWIQHNDQLSVGLLVQLVEHCTGIAEVMGSNLVRAWIFFRSYFQLLISVVFLAARIS